jgi:2-oxoisovalerate dehydrogenase E1 component
MSSLEESKVGPLSNDVLIRLYRMMRTIRDCEEELARCHQRGLIHGACHTYVGEEAIATAVCDHLSDQDVVFSTHRGHGHALAKGADPTALMAELFGRKTGLSKGRGGSMHLFSPEIGLLGTSGIVGPCILQAAGGGYAFQLMENDGVAVAFFGDGAVNNGAFHEGLNLASIWNLPTIFVCENNQFATEVAFSYASGNARVGNRGPAYGMPSYELDGNDVLAIHQVSGEAVARARRGDGPTLIECKTYRTRAHAEGMGDFSYRTKQDVEDWKERCPIDRLRSQLVDNGMPEVELDEIDAEIKSQMKHSRGIAEESDYPAAETATQFVYAQPKQHTTHLLDEPPHDERREVSYTVATHEALVAAMAKDDRIFVLGEGIGVRGGNFNTTQGLYERHGPKRLRDTPICERGFMGLACGAAMSGARPVVDFMFADFILDAVGEVFNQIAKMQYMSSGRLKMPLLMRGCIGIGHSAATHHSGSYYSMYSQVPGLRVVVPSTPFDAKGLFAQALVSDDPVMFLEHRELLTVKGPVPDQEYVIDFGKARVLRPGDNVTVVALARMVHLTLAVCEELQAEGISVEVIDPRTISPLDIPTVLASVHKTGRLLIVDETPGPCSIASEIAAQVVELGFDDLDAPVKRLHGAFAPTPYSPTLEAALVPNQVTIAAAIRDLMEE